MYDAVLKLGNVGASETVASRSSVLPGSTKLRTPAFRVPVAPGVHVVLGHNNQVPRALTHQVVASGTSIGLLPTHVTHLETGRLSPFGRRPASGRRWRHIDEPQVAPVLSRHQRLPFGM